MTRTRTEKLDLLQGTLDMMVLRTLSAGPANGYEIARAIERLSDDVLAVDHGSLYPALHRLERSGLVVANWETSSTNRRARYYRAMELITILKRCHRFRGFVYQHAHFGADNKSIEVAVRPRKGSTAVCSRCHLPAPGFDPLTERRFEFIPLWRKDACHHQMA